MTPPLISCREPPSACRRLQASPPRQALFYPACPALAAPLLWVPWMHGLAFLGAGVCEDGQGLVPQRHQRNSRHCLDTRKCPHPGVIAFAECEGIVLHAGPTQSGGASVEWLCRVLGKTAPEISALAASADVSNLPLFLPHLEGERAPLWDISAKGSFSGLTSSMGATRIGPRRARRRRLFRPPRLRIPRRPQQALRPETIHHSGGGAASEIWCQIRADILGRPVQRTVMRDAGVLGAALMAGVGAGVFSSLHDAAKDFVQMDREFLCRTHKKQRGITGGLSNTSCFTGSWYRSIRAL